MVALLMGLPPEIHDPGLNIDPARGAGNRLRHAFQSLAATFRVASGAGPRPTATRLTVRLPIWCDFSPRPVCRLPASRPPPARCQAAATSASPGAAPPP